LGKTKKKSYRFTRDQKRKQQGVMAWAICVFGMGGLKGSRAAGQPGKTSMKLSLFLAAGCANHGE